MAACKQPTVTVDVADIVDPVVAFPFELVDVNGMPIEQISVGETFFLNVFAEDLSEITLGVFAAYLDVNWTGTGNVSVSGDLVFGESFGSQQSGEPVNNLSREIDELGAADGIVPTNSARELLVIVPLSADQPGQVTFEGSEADILPIHQTLVYERSTRVPVSQQLFDSQTITVVGTLATRTNLVNPFDVDANGAVSPLDALMVINELNSPINGAFAIRADEPMTDVNADGVVTPIDALLVINQLNGGAGQQRAAMSAGSTSGGPDSTGAMSEFTDEQVTSLEAPHVQTPSGSAPALHVSLNTVDAFFVDEEDGQADNEMESMFALLALDAHRSSSNN